MSKKQLLCLAVFGVVATLVQSAASKAHADEPYLEVNATRIQSYGATVPGVTDRLVEQKGLWGAEIFGRVPLTGKLAVIGRLYSEGAAGSHSFRDPSTWHRAVGEGALSYRVFRFGLEDAPDRYTVGLMAGAGLSWMLERGSYTDLVPDEENELDGPPPKFGFGAHLRDSKLGSWLNLRAEWDKAVGEGAAWCGGCLIAASLHVPVFGQRAGFGLDVVYGENTKVNVAAKVRIKRWGAK